MVAFFDAPDEAGAAVSDVFAEGLVPAAMEIMDKLTIGACEEATGVGFPEEAGAALVIELDGSEAEVQAAFDRVVEICREDGAWEVRIAEDEAEAELIWKGRKAAFAAMGRISPDYFVQDSVLSRTKLPEVLRRIEELSDEYGLKVANVFHAGDGNLHPLVCYDGSEEGEAHRAEELSGAIVSACVDAGGSITGEHGVGVDKACLMPKMFSESDLEAFERLRRAFDPAGLANPEKLMPTPRLCGEVPGPYKEHPLERAGLAERL
jgi:glycolate oxidase